MSVTPVVPNPLNLVKQIQTLFAVYFQPALTNRTTVKPLLNQ